MWIDRFQATLRDVLREHPDVVSVETVPMPDNEHPLTELKVTLTDGTSMILHVVRSSPGGEDFTQAERIVTKPGYVPAGG
jgi:hypothetical protein